MAAGAVANCAADCARSVTGVAGPGGGTATKPVGMVCFGWIARGSQPRTATLHLPGDRAAVRDASVEASLSGLLELIGEVPL
jgi:nicotinamide-nucleotide amidase